MLEGDRAGMERQTLVSFIFFAVTLIADHRVADIGEVHTDLMLPPG